MKYSAVLFLLILFSLSVFAQKTNTTKKPVNSTKTTVKLGTEKEEFEKAVALTNPLERIAALQKFLKNFPKSAEKTRALELIVSARGQIGDDKLRLGETASGIEFFKAAVKDAPVPVSDELFTGLLLQFPTNLFSRGQVEAAVELAKSIEEKIGENPKHILALATFYLGTENGAQAKRLAEKAILAETNLTEKPEKSNLPAAYQLLGLANRINFDFEESANSYTKALELDGASNVSRRGLAEMKRSLGKPDEAIALYKEILAKDETDETAKTGLILALFDTGKRAEAETEMAKSLEANPNNLFLLVGAAYWYAAHNEGAKAVDLAQKAIAFEPRYTWSYIALARGQMAQKLPLEAEKTLLKARQYGDFPTLDYELAAARMQAGFYRDAAEILKRSFFVKEDYIKAWIGNRVPLEAKSFLELLAVERRASIFEPLAADNNDNAEKLKNLLELSQKFDAADASETEIVDLADKFISGEDNMKLHRQLFVARRLLQQKKALPKILEIMQSSVSKVDAALNAENAASAVLAEELYTSRAYALSRGELVIVPSVPRQTLSKILRGEIEEIYGWTLFQQNKSGEAVVRLKRALTVLPEKSAWWRSSMWRLGAALEAEGKSAEALDSYIKSYLDAEPDAAKYLVIEALYQKINGTTDGLGEKIGAKPTIIPNIPNAQNQTVAQTTETKTESTPVATPTAEATPQPNLVVVTTEISSNSQTETPATPSFSPTPVPALTGETKIESSPSPLPEKQVQNERETIEKARAVKSETETKTVETSNTPKPLFEPIIITIPKTVTSGETRERKASEEKTEEIAPCTIVASQENVSLLSGGGSLGVLVGFEKEGDLKQIKAVSSSPKDVEVIYEPDIGEDSGRAFFLVKSISAVKGAFTVTFESPCGKKEIIVKVR
jgi:tetratricopeptide (TPR) repeat protein